MSAQSYCQEYGHTSQIRILVEHQEFEIADRLRENLEACGAQAEIKSFAVQAGRPISDQWTHIIAIMPRTPAHCLTDRKRIERMVERLQVLTQLPSSNAQRGLTVVQFGDGRFGAGPEPSEIDCCCAASFAKSVHLERPDLRIRMLDFSPSMPVGPMAERILTESQGDEAFASVGFDAAGRRLVPQMRLHQPQSYPRRPHAWGKGDVILVTGGAKGITAACALGVARSTGARFALVGRSSEPSSNDTENEILQTLQRFQESQSEARYFQCDVSQAEEVERLVSRVREEMGLITGVIHGAGLNSPRRANTVSVAEALKEVSPKLLGARNLCQALSATPPKLFVGLTSIIGVTGMPGNAWYAFSNEALDLMLQRFAKEHSGTSVQSVAYSIWGEVGMGHRLNSVQGLARLGITAIPTAEGVERFVHLFEHDPGAKQVVVTARLGGLDTWAQPEPSLPEGFRFIENILHHQPRVELTARTRLSLDRDLYLADHNFRGSYLFPTVFGLEAMAQTAAVLMEQSTPQFVRIENITLERPLVVDPQKGVEIELRALTHETTSNGETAIEVQIRSEQTGFSVAHFRATFVVGTPAPSPQTDIKADGVPLDILPQGDLYGDLLFQGPRFQRMGPIYELDGDHAVFASDCQSAEACVRQAFDSCESQTLLLGDPFLRDVLLQAGQLTIPQEVCLPVGIEKIERFGSEGTVPGRRIVVAPFKVRQGNEYTAEVFVTDERGHLLERLSGYRLRILNEDKTRPTAEDLANPNGRDEQLLEHALKQLAGEDWECPSVAVENIRQLHDLPRDKRRRQERPVIERVNARWSKRKNLPVSPCEVDWLPSGRPVMQGGKEAQQDLSLSHDEGCCVCVVGGGPQGCDVLPITTRTPEDWTALLGDHRTELREELHRSGDSVDEAGSRLWAAVEAIRKATQAAEISFTVQARQGGSVLLRTTASETPLTVATFPLRLTCAVPVACSRS